MNLLNELNFNNVFIQTINDEKFKKLNIQVDVLRLDTIHPVVSGNKWFKLKYWLQQAATNNFKTIATFGGAFSNHILATAYACAKQNFSCIGFIRGEEPKYYSPTLLDAKALNMQLIFLKRDDFSNQKNIINQNPALFFIPEGGYGIEGATGAEEIMQSVPQNLAYDYIICAVGTGTMLAGIANASAPHQQCVGISVMKNNKSLETETKALMNNSNKEKMRILHHYHFGGYAKYSNNLIDFINAQWLKHRLPLDFVYTAKAFYGLHDLIENDYFKHSSKILFIHSGGLQGNRSLKNKLLH